MTKTFFTSDHHFGHANIIKYCNRPFSNVNEMDETMIARWNEIVNPKDTVYHLGDFTLLGCKDAQRYFARLNGRIFVLANTWHHDKRWLSAAKYQYCTTANSIVTFVPPMVVLEYPELSDSQYPLAITLCHYPLARFDRQHYGAWHLHGHSHGNYKADGCVLDVGVDVIDFRPISLEKVVERMRLAKL